MWTWRCGKTFLCHPEGSPWWRRTCIHLWKRAAARSEERREVTKTCLQGFLYLCLFTCSCTHGIKKKSLFFSQLDFSIFHHIPVGATNSHSHPHVSEKNKRIWAESLIQQIGGKWKDTSQKVLYLCKKESFHRIAQSCESFFCADMSCLVFVKHYGHFGLDCAEDIIPEVL